MRHDISSPAATFPHDLPLALANTVYIARGTVHDDLASTDRLTEWLRVSAPALRTMLDERDLASVTLADLDTAHDLRDAIRSIIAALAEGRAPDAASRYRLNQRAAAAPAWPQLHWDHGPVSRRHSDAGPIATALAEIAGDAVEFFADPSAAGLHECSAPECIRYYVSDDSRRKWCSPACGNRARVARYYRRTRA